MLDASFLLISLYEALYPVCNDNRSIAQMANLNSQVCLMPNVEAGKNKEIY